MGKLDDDIKSVQKLKFSNFFKLFWFGWKRKNDKEKSTFEPFSEKEH